MSRHNVVYYYKIGFWPTAAAKNGGMRMRLISWNVNGLRACESVDADTGECTTGSAFATCAGFLCHALLTAC